MRAPRKRRKQHVDGDLRAVVDETIALFHRVRYVADQTHGAGGRATAQRGFLRRVVRYGPRTVPQLALARAVTRQHTQESVDRLVEQGLVELVANPAHKRSPLVRATRKGTALIASLDDIDARVLVAIGGGLSRAELAITARTLRGRARALRSRRAVARRGRVACYF